MNLGVQDTLKLLKLPEPELKLNYHNSDNESDIEYEYDDGFENETSQDDRNCYKDQKNVYKN